MNHVPGDYKSMKFTKAIKHVYIKDNKPTWLLKISLINALGFKVHLTDQRSYDNGLVAMKKTPLRKFWNNLTIRKYVV